MWLAFGAPIVPAQQARELALEQHPFRLYSAFWPNLHHVLWAEAWARRPSTEEKAAAALPEPLTGNLSATERRAWEAAVSYYDAEIADLHLLFEMGQIRKLIITAQDELPASGLAPAHRQVLAAAGPVYRKYWWPAHDRANRAWIQETMSKVSSLSPAVPDRLVRLYGTPWFTKSLRVDVVRVGAREGAYASNQPEPGHITISSSKAAIEGWMAAEVLFHEASHMLVRPFIEAFSAELRAQGKLTAGGGTPSRNAELWHVALFYTTGDVVRRVLAERGIAYEPYLYKTGLFDRAWPQFKTPIETHWKGHLNGELSREEAVKRIVTAIK
jgi:hypothetical protein